MYKNGLLFSTMSVSVARKSRLQSSRTAKHAQIGTENDWQKCVIDCWCNKWAGVINGLLIRILKAAEG